jgi:phosphatidylinositol glycan class V
MGVQQDCEHINILLSALFITWLSSSLAAALLFVLSVRVLRSWSLAYTASMCFILSPAGVFFSVAYTESLFALLTFGGLLLWHERHPLPAALVFACASMVRSNGALFAALFAWDAVRNAIKARAYGVRAWRAVGWSLLLTAIVGE